jgi:hypothetical protein
MRYDDQVMKQLKVCNILDPAQCSAYGIWSLPITFVTYPAEITLCWKMEGIPFGLVRLKYWYIF